MKCAFVRRKLEREIKESSASGAGGKGLRNFRLTEINFRPDTRYVRKVLFSPLKIGLATFPSTKVVFCHSSCQWRDCKPKPGSNVHQEYESMLGCKMPRHHTTSSSTSSLLPSPRRKLHSLSCRNITQQSVFNITSINMSELFTRRYIETAETPQTFKFAQSVSTSFDRNL